MLRVLLSAGGFGNALPLLAAGLVLALVFHDGTIDTLGPISFSPSIPVMVAVPLVLSVGIALAHGVAPTPVVFRNVRVMMARSISYGAAALSSTGIVLIGGALSTSDDLGPSLRNLMLFGALAVTTAVMVGLIYAWIPVILVFGLAVLSQVNGSPWSVYGLVLGGGSSAQFAVVGAVALAALVLAVWDPRSRGYLRPARTAR